MELHQKVVLVSLFLLSCALRTFSAKMPEDELTPEAVTATLLSQLLEQGTVSDEYIYSTIQSTNVPILGATYDAHLDIAILHEVL